MRAMQNILKRFRSLIKSLTSDDGFSLMELMIVITIIGILSLLVVPKLMDIPKKANVSAAKQQMTAFGIALDRYYLDNSNYPSTDQGLNALIEKPGSEPSPMNYNPGGYMKRKEIPKDPWGREYIYSSPGPDESDYGITSLGADGREGGTGYDTDLNSWER